MIQRLSLTEILDGIEKHLKANKIKRSDAAINISNGQPGGELIDMTRRDLLYYLRTGKHSKKDYKHFDAIIEKENGRKICTYAVYEW